MNLGYKIIACDFDGTLCTNAWPEIGEPNRELLMHLRIEQAKGNKVILWTCRTGELLDKAVNWCVDHGLKLDGINENLPEVIEHMGGDTRKIYADEYIDDKMSGRFWYLGREDLRIPTLKFKFVDETRIPDPYDIKTVLL